jgi:hypothetical protein
MDYHEMNDYNQRVSRIAYLLWQARGCPEGSPDVDWQTAQNLVMSCDAESPFDIANTNRCLGAFVFGPEDDAGYAQVMEDRRNLSDLLARVGMLRRVYVQLCSLAKLRRAARGVVEAVMPFTQLNAQQYDVPREIIKQEGLIAKTLVLSLHSSTTK